MKNYSYRTGSSLPVFQNTTKQQKTITERARLYS